MNKNAPKEKFKSLSNHRIFGGQMKKIILFSIISIILISSITLAVTDVKSNTRHNRVIVRASSPINRESFKLQGCKITHELRDATALDCPDNVKIQGSETDTVLHILDLSSDAQIKADQVWSSYTGSGATVAVLDTGIDYTHLQLSSSSGSIDPTNGHCFAVTGGDCGNGFFDDNGHGTHVSGIITSDGIADSNNGAFSKGVAPGSNIWMAKVCDAGGNCYVSDIIAAIQYVVNNHIAKVMSLSLGGGANIGANCDNDYLAQQINWAYDNGVVAVIAAGNGGSVGVGSPACASKAIAVAAVDSSDNLASFSSYGNALKDHGVAAPGVSIFSSLQGNTYAYWSGTSMATPHVSAVVALMLSKNPGLAPADIRSTIFSSADCLNNKYGACPNINIGYGRVDALKAVNPTPSVPSLSLSANPSSITTAQSSTITASTSDIKSDVTISFSTNLGSIPTNCTSDSTGKCSVTFSSSTAGTATITESANGYNSGSTSVKVTPVTYTATFSNSGIPSGRIWGVTVGTTRYTSTTSSVSVSGLSRTASYTYDSAVSGTTGTRYVCSTGCSGSVTSTDNNKAATYKTQYQLTMVASPASYGTTSPTTGWYDSGSVVRITASPKRSYIFSSWYGSGTGSYTGTANPATVTMRAPITQTARFTFSRQNLNLR